MPRRAVTIFSPYNEAAYDAPDTTNEEGYKGWSRPLDEQLIQTLLSNTFGNTYYATARELTKESAAIHSAALAASPTFYAKALVFARNEGFMRTQPIYGLALLSTVHPDLFKKVFDRVILTPNDLSDFMSILSKFRKGQGGRAVKRAVAKWLVKNFSADSKNAEYWAIKYGADKQGSYSLKDIIRTTHPVGLRRDIVKYLLGKEPDLSSMPQIEAFEALKIGVNATARAKAITEGRLPHEVATPFAGSDKVVWNAIIPQMPTFALLRNLATMERHDVATSNKEYVTNKLSEGGAIKKAKILPFRFYEAFKKVKSGWLQDVLRSGLEASFESIPNFSGSTAVLLDISGSMMSFLSTAALFGVCAARKGDDNVLVTFDTAAYPVKVSKLDSILTQAEALVTKGSTDTSAPIQYLIKNNIKVSNLLMITDEQQNSGSPMFKTYLKYKEHVNRNVKLFIVDVSPYTSGASTPKSDDIYYLYGWSDQVLNFISMATRGWGTQVEEVNERVDLS